MDHSPQFWHRWVISSIFTHWCRRANKYAAFTKNHKSRCRDDAIARLTNYLQRLVGDSPGGLLFLIYYHSCQLRTDRLSRLRSTSYYIGNQHGWSTPYGRGGMRRDTSCVRRCNWCRIHGPLEIFKIQRK